MKFLENLKRIMGTQDVQDAMMFAMKVTGAAVFTAAVLSASGAMAADGITLPTTGVDVGAYLTAGISALGAVVAIAIGGFIAFLLIKKGLRWAGRALG